MLYDSRTTDTQWRHKSKKSENFGRCSRQNMLRPHLKIWEWELILVRAVKTISSPGVRSPWYDSFRIYIHTRCLPAALHSDTFCQFFVQPEFLFKRKLIIFVSRILLPPALLTKFWPKCWKITKFSFQNFLKDADDSLICRVPKEFQSHLVYYFGILHELRQEFLLEQTFLTVTLF